MIRPNAPLIEATAELLEGWCGPVVWDDEPATHVPSTEGGGRSGLVGSPCDEWTTLSFHGDRMFLLDLRRPEVRYRWGEVRWGSPDVCVDAPGYPHARLLAGSDIAAAAGERDAFYANDRGCLHAPALATLPDTDTLAWACWHVEQAIRAGEGRDAD